MERSAKTLLAPGLVCAQRCGPPQVDCGANEISDD
jgi:hypothetical protein